MLFFLRTLFIVIVFSLWGCASKNLTEGIKRFDAGDYRQAFVRLKMEAKKGQPDAQYAVGYMYYYGQGVVENRKRAWYWINKAASAKQPDALAALAIMKKQPETILS